MERSATIMHSDTPPAGSALLGRLAAAFSNAPGSTYFYSSLNHRRLLDGLLSALRGRMGMHLILGDFGTGKTTLCNYLLMAYGHEFDMVYLGNPFLTEAELFGHLGAELGVAGAGSGTAKERLDSLEAHLRSSRAASRPVVLFIDEAHLLEFEIFDRLLVLSNLQESGIPLLQMVLVGVPKLLDILAAPRFTSLNQRIGSRHMLRPLSMEETAQYIRQRLSMAGGQHLEVFGPGAMAEIHRLSGGRPRLINMLCRLTLENLGLEGGAAVSGAQVRRLAQDPSFRPVFEDGRQPAAEAKPETWRMLWPPLIAAGVVGGVSILLAARLLRETPETRSGAGAEVRQAVQGPERAADATAPAALPSLDAPASAMADAAAPPAAPGQDEGDLQPWPLRPAPAQPSRGQGASQPPAVPKEPQKAKPVRERPAAQERPKAPAAQTTVPPSPPAPAREAAEASRSAPADPLPADLAGVRVQAIAWSRQPENRIAMVGGTVVHIGDAFAGGSVTAINEDHLVLNRQGQRHVLRLSADKP